MIVDDILVIVADVSGIIVIVVEELVIGCVIFASILQQTRLSGHNPYRGFITPSPEMETIPLGSHKDIITQIQFSNTVVGEVTEVGTVAVVGIVGVGVDGGIVENVIEGIDGAVGDVAGGIRDTLVGDVVGGVIRDTFIEDVTKDITAILVTFGR